MISQKLISQKLEDFAGKAFLVGICSWLLVQHCVWLVAQLHAAERPDNFVLLAVSQVLSVLFVAMIIALTIRRLPARSNAAGLEPRAAAIAGTVLLMLLIWLPSGTPSTEALIAANVLIAVGTLGSIYCLHFLGRSFSMMASARELVTEGPYAHVRHPLYFAEALTCVGIVMAHGSWLAVLVGVAQLLVQFRRMQLEEKVLRDAFPDYEAYAARVPMIFALLRPADLSDLKGPAADTVPAQA
ncbi:MAG: methyltransferase family protein [Sandaracinobacteroides sp.]